MKLECLVNTVKYFYLALLGLASPVMLRVNSNQGFMIKNFRNNRVIQNARVIIQLELELNEMFQIFEHNHCN